MSTNTLPVCTHCIFFHIRFEDGETNGLSMPDNSLRKTRRCRSINVNGPEIERRKSRRHSCCKHMVFLCVMFESALNPSISKVVYKLERKENQLPQYRIFPVIHIRFFLCGDNRPFVEYERVIGCIEWLQVQIVVGSASTHGRG